MDTPLNLYESGSNNLYQVSTDRPIENDIKIPGGHKKIPTGFTTLKGFSCEIL